MRALFVMVAMVMAACSQPSTQTSYRQSPSPTAAASVCSLPVWWPDDIGVRAAFVSVPDGAVTDVGVLPPPPEVAGVLPGGFGGATYVSGTRTWLRVDGHNLAPDGKRYVYWTGTPTESELRLVDVASGAGRVIYSGPNMYVPLSFESDVIYLRHAVNPKQGGFENLYRLDPSGGTPALVPGTDSGQVSWVLISDGAAWGVAARVNLTSVVRLDLATSQITEWFAGPMNELVWPLGTDTKHRLYVQGLKQNVLWRVETSGQADQLAYPGPIGPSASWGGSYSFIADARGVWIKSQGSVWLYPDAGVPKKFVVGRSNEDVWPAGPCL